MIKEVPVIARMIVINDVINEDKTKNTDNSYYNFKLDGDSEYCQNTTAWD